MKERPILFSAPMVRAILDGSKTQTRRAIRPQPDLVKAGTVGKDAIHGRFTKDDGRLGRMGQVIHCPYGVPGDSLWVREMFAGALAYELHNYPLREWGNKIWYVADGEPRSGQWTRPRPSIHMPRTLSRITLEVTDVRVERLQDISEADAIAEGAPPSHRSLDRISREYGFADFSRSWYGHLWESINGAGSWDANPWVWCVEFKRVAGGPA